MHGDCLQFVERMKALYPSAFDGATSVVEAGSLDVNGSARRFFPANARYVGVDWRPGPGVDVVSLFHEFLCDPVDFVLSTETFEHDPFWASTFTRMLTLTRPGGSVLVTAAGAGRKVHFIDTSPWPDYYRNLSLGALLRGLYGQTTAEFEAIHGEEDRRAKDVRLFLYRKLGESIGGT